MRNRMCRKINIINSPINNKAKLVVAIFCCFLFLFFLFILGVCSRLLSSLFLFFLDFFFGGFLAHVIQLLWPPIAGRDVCPSCIHPSLRDCSSWLLLYVQVCREVLLGRLIPCSWYNLYKLTRQNQCLNNFSACICPVIISF